MVYYVGTVSGGSGAASALAISAQLRTTIPTHANWTLVDSTTMAGATPCDVYKCSSAGNGLAVDFYVAVMTNAATIMISLAEGYNTLTHKPKRPAMGNPGSTAQTLQADGGLMPATTELDWFNGIYGGFVSVQAGYCSSGTVAVQDYAISLAADGILLVVSGTGTAYAGVYDSLVPTPATNDPVPLLAATTAINGNWPPGGWASTRHPMRGGLSTPWPCAVGGSNNYMNFVNCVLLNESMGGVAWPSVGVITSGTDSGDLYLGGNVPASRIAVHNAFSGGTAAAGRDKTGGVRGMAKRLRHLPTNGPTFQDTLVIDGVTYAYVGGGASGLWHERNPA